VKLFLADGLTCKCGSSDLYLSDVYLHHGGLALDFFRMSIYFYCPFCERRWVHMVKKHKTRVFIKQKHIAAADQCG
jgi:hypothetical protein